MNMRWREWLAAGAMVLWIVSVVTADPTVAIVLKVNKDVRQHGPGGDWQPAKAGMQLVAGHRLRTGDDSFCALIFQDDQSLLKLSSNTEVTLNATPEPGGKLSKRLFLGLGDVWAKAAKEEGRTFEIETPTSVASVKGSAGYDSVDTSGATRMYVREGLWGFSNRFGSADVGAGFDAFSDGLNPPVVTPTEPGEAPTFSQANPIPGIEPGPEGGPRGEGPQEGVGELRIGMTQEDGTTKTLVIRYQE